MAETTEISWAHSTFNPWIGCTKVSPGCDNCYAERDMAIRRGRVVWGLNQDRSPTSESYWRQPLAWNRKATLGGPWRVFCASLADVFDKDAPEDYRARLWPLIEETPSLTWMLLTKRIGRWRDVVPRRWHLGFPRNVWMGATVVNQEEADRDIPKLLGVPAAVRWLSCEPLLGPIDFKWEASALDWIIVGGESGPKARPMDPAWARSIRDQCEANRIAFHFKQWGGVRPKDGGHLLDGKEHRAFPDCVHRKGD